MTGDTVEFRVPFYMAVQGVHRDKNLSSNAKEVYVVFAIFCRGKNFCDPAIETIADFLGISVGRVNRAINELVDGFWISRIKRIGTSCVTVIYQDPSDNPAYPDISPVIDRYAMDDRSDVSPVAQEVLLKNIINNTCEDQKGGGSAEQNSFFPAEQTASKQEDAGSPAEQDKKDPNMPQKRDLRPVIELLRKFWYLVPPTETKKKGGFYAGVNELIAACEGLDPVEVITAYHNEYAEAERNGRAYKVTSPYSLKNSISVFAEKMRQNREQSRGKQMYNDKGKPVFYG